VGRFLSKLFRRCVGGDALLSLLRVCILKELVAANRELHKLGFSYCYDYELVCVDADLRKYTLYLYKVVPFSRHELVFSESSGVFGEVGTIIRDLPK